MNCKRRGWRVAKGDLQTLITVGAKLARDGAITADKHFPDAPGLNCRSWPAGNGDLTANDYFPDAPGLNCRSWPGGDGGLRADDYFPDAPGINCRSWPAGDGGLIGGEIVAGVHIHSCGHGFYRFRFYSESL